MATLSVSLQAGATNGPVDMSITVNFYAVEAGIFVANLQSVDPSNSLRTRFSQAEANCEQQGATTFQLTLSPLEQGLMLGCLSNATCQLASSVLMRLQAAIVAKLQALGAPGGLN